MIHGGVIMVPGSKVVLEALYCTFGSSAGLVVGRGMRARLDIGNVKMA